MKRLLMVALLMALVGCATQISYKDRSEQAIGSNVRADQGISYMDRAEQAIQNRQWEVAYRFLEDGFTSNRPETKARVLKLYETYPEIRSAALNTFSFDSLSKSRVLYGAPDAWAIETKRLQMYLQAANHADFEMAKANMEHSFADIAKQDAERKRLEELSEKQRQKIADEKRSEVEASNARRMETRLQAQRALGLAAENARFICKDKPECDKAFSLTQIYIVSKSDMKIQVANDTIIETYNATERMNISLKAIKMPRAGSTAEILLSVDCKDDGKESLKDWCNSKSMSVYSEFPQFMQKNLIK